MRTLLLLLLLGILSCCKEEVSLPEEPSGGKPKPDAVRIPDAEFEKRLIELKIDSDQNANGWVSLADMKNVDSLKLRSIANSKYTQIKSLKGIEHFPNLVYLDCLGNDIDSLDLSQNKKLKWLNCSGYRLDVGGWLERQLDYLNISENLEIEELYLGLTYWELPMVSHLQKLRKAEFGGYLRQLDVSQNLALTSLKIYEGNSMRNLDVSKNTLLKELSFSDTRISTIDLSNNLNLEKLFCTRNKLRALDLSNATKIKELDCSFNELAELNVKGLNDLTKFNCSYNNDYKGRSISYLDLSDNTKLVDLDINNINVSSLQLDNNANIENLSFSKVPITSINLEKLVNLKYLRAGGSKLIELALKNNKKLDFLDCSETNLELIDVSNNENITILNCLGNSNLKQIDVRNCKKLNYLSAARSINLKTICVSSVAEAVAKPNWTKDAHTEYKVCN